MESIIWLAIVIVLLVIEMITLGLTSIWFAGGALVAFFASLFHAGTVTEIILFLVVSVVLLFSTRPVALKYMNRNKTRTNVDSLIGKEAVVTQEINNLMGTGTVTVNGIEWTARAEAETDQISEQTVVEIVKVDGVKLIVQRKGGK